MDLENGIDDRYNSDVIFMILWYECQEPSIKNSLNYNKWQLFYIGKKIKERSLVSSINGFHQVSASEPMNVLLGT